MELNYKRIGERVQRARKLRKMSTTELAQLVHFTPKSIIFAEAGQAALSLEFLLALCSALDVTPNDLLDGEYQNTKAATQSLEQEAIIAELREMLAAVQDVGAEEPRKGGTVIKDTETVIDEIRQMVMEYKVEQERNPPEKKKMVHW